MAKLSKQDAARAYQNGLKALEAKKYFEARAQFAAVAESYPNAAEAWYQMGLVNKTLGRPLSAAQCFERALEIKPEQWEILQELEAMSRKVGRPDFAVKLNQRMASLRPHDTGAQLNEGLALQQMGAFDEAEKRFKKAIKTVKELGSLYRVWFHGRKIKSASDPHFKRALDLWNRNTLHKQERLALGYALAKAVDDLGQYDKAFHFLSKANDIGKELYPFDRPARERETNAFIAASQEDVVVRNGTSDFAPIFVIGTPRSGTTLVERIISAHPEVTSGGEVAQGSFLFPVFFMRKKVFGLLSKATPEDVDGFAKHYETSAREAAQAQEGIVTDKSMQLQRMIGWLARAYPKAKFVVVRRDPRDVALSIYRNYFRPGDHTYSHDLRDIAFILRDFDRLIKHWRGKVPFIEVDYNDLTANPEAESRKLVAGVGLEWDDACLEFYKQKTAVRTLSLAQVRQPIYKSSSGGWQRYEAEMQPFIEEWERLG